MSTGDWTDDEHEPLAPLPAHERAWRHPSELGDQEWRMSEPPVAIGRGLSVTTGMVGSLLVFAILWTVLPASGGRGSVTGARATVVTLGIDTLAGFADVSSTVEAPAGGPQAVTTHLTRPSTTVTTVSRTPERPLPTFEVRSTLAFSSGTGKSSTDGTPMIAVPVEGGSLLITTAPAVAAGTEVEIAFADGSTGRATVVVVDQRSGLAVLTPEAGHATEAFELAAEVSPDDELTVFGDPAMTVSMGDDGVATAEMPADVDLPEGAPVLNQRGELVGLCSRGDDGLAHLVTLETLDHIRLAMASSEAPVWLGLVINDDPAHDLSVGAVDPEGPAAAAGVVTGDVIVAADGVELADCDALVAYLALHEPGDIVRLTLRGADGELRDVEVELAEPKTAV